MRFTLREWNTIQGLLIVRRNELQKLQDNAETEELREIYKKDKWNVQRILDKLEQEEI